jgi:AcrR family transcriptional regulator
LCPRGGLRYDRHVLMADLAPKPTASSRERVLAGATAEFAAHGFAGARIDRIARRVGLNVRMIYYHFGNKDGLYKGVLREIYSNAAEMIDRVYSEGDPEQRSVQAISQWFDLITSHDHFADIMVREFLDGGEHLRKLFADEPQVYERVHKRAVKLVEGFIEAGYMRELPAAQSVVLVTFSAAFLWASRGVHDLFLGGDRPGPTEWKTRLVDLVLHGMMRPQQ